MSHIPWEHESSLLRMTGAGEEVVRRDTLHQLVGHFLELPPERQRGLSIRASGPDWTRESTSGRSPSWRLGRNMKAPMAAMTRIRSGLIFPACRTKGWRRRSIPPRAAVELAMIQAREGK
jgi:hypothetical protein